MKLLPKSACSPPECRRQAKDLDSPQYEDSAVSWVLKRLRHVSTCRNDDYESAARIARLLACDSLGKACVPALSGELCRLLLPDIPDLFYHVPSSKGHLGCTTVGWSQSRGSI